MKAAVLAIGTELTTGQIPNTHGPWIGQQLKKMGVECLHHLSIPDDREEIQQSLKFINSKNDLIFITGGLGPTADDFTREEIAKFLGQKLIYSEEAWSHIVDRLGSRGVPVRDNQKQQCYFPESAKLLSNPEGTAYGFYVQQNNKYYFVLPGPPRELQTIWRLHLQSLLLNLTVSLDPLLTKIWDVIGIGEGEIAHFLDEALKAEAPVDLAYRVHPPYVEVKLTYKKSEFLKWQKALNIIQQTLQSYLATENGEDIFLTWYQSLKADRVYCVIDQLTEGYLNERLQKCLPKREMLKQIVFSQNASFTPPLGAELLILTSDRQVLLNGQRLSIQSPYAANFHTLERSKQYITEMAFFNWVKKIATPQN